MKPSILNFITLAILVFASCNEDGDFDKDFDEKDDWEIKDDDKNDEGKDCFDLVYPVTYIMPTGDAISGNDDETLWADIKIWYENNDSKEKPALEYPVDIIWEEGETQTIANEEEMIDAKKDCKDEKDCFGLVYPVTYAMPDGSMVSGEKEEIEAAIKTWYENNDSAKKPVLEYPVDIIWEEGETKSIANEEEMIDAKKDCEDEKGWKKDCFELVYPVTYTMPDGSMVSGDADELEISTEAWYDEHPDVEEKPILQYPVDIIFEDEIMQTVEDESAMIEVKKDC